MTKTQTIFSDWSEESKQNFNDWVDYYRKNPHRFAIEYLGLDLAPFQQILLYCMANPNTNRLTTFDFFASRGIGKTYLTMVFSCCMAILYPGIDIAVVSSSKRTSGEFMKKINELMDYPNLVGELNLDKTNPDSKDDAKIVFKGGSTITNKVCNENARGGRVQILIFDERNIMDSRIISNVFIPMLTHKRHIPSYRKPQYAKYRSQEHNSKIYLTSIGYSDDDAYIEFEKFAKLMASGDSTYTCFSLPYQFGVEAGIIDKSLIYSQAKENKTDLSSFQSEMEVIPIGSSENAIFTRLEVTKAQQILTPLIEPTAKQYIECRGDLSTLQTYQPKQRGEVRVLSVDIATAMGRKNDASAWTILRLFNQGEYYDKYLSFHKAINGMNIDTQVLFTKRLWHYFDIDYVVIDAGGAIGIAFAQLLGALTVDMQLGTTYPGFKTMNRDSKYDCRVTDEGAVPVLYCMQVSGAGASQMQADMAFLSKVNFERKRIYMLVDESEGVDSLNDRYKYMKLKTSPNFSDREIAENMYSSFWETKELIKEMLTVKLKKLPSGRWTIEEKASDRKDRLISLLYCCYFVDILEQDLTFIDRRVDLSAYAQASGATKVGGLVAGKKNPFANRNAFTGGFGRR